MSIDERSTDAPGPLPAPPLPADPAVRQSLRYCHRVTRQRARNFYYGLKLTPEPRRSAVYTIYAFMRACDDLVDAPVDVHAKHYGQQALEDVQSGLARIEAFRGRMQEVLSLPAGAPVPDNQPPKNSPWPAFNYVCHAYPIDPAHLHAMLDGQRNDLLQHSFASFDQLYDYCYKVAGVVGLVCISIWGTNGDRAALKLAEYRGIALQLTNILRDLVEDARRDRVYLPKDELDRFGYDPKLLLERKANQTFERLMNFQIQRALSYYEMSARLEEYINPACRSTSWALCRIYRGLLDKIAADPGRVLRQRVRLSSFQKLGIALRAGWRRRRESA